MIPRSRVIPFIALLAPLFLGGSFGFSAASSWADKVAPDVLRQANESGEAEFIVYLGSKADLDVVSPSATKDEKTRQTYRTLKPFEN